MSANIFPPTVKACVFLSNGNVSLAACKVRQSATFSCKICS
ncbi:hypothetical protein SAMD00023518_01505 [Listeria monocytogenes]|nr:hypothetical protein SAMD00023518_01505 [Listeria monocytogenes]